jgi:hypothetical protein
VDQDGVMSEFGVSDNVPFTNLGVTDSTLSVASDTRLVLGAFDVLTFTNLGITDFAKPMTWNGSTWEEGPAYIWNGAAWVSSMEAWWWDGSTWRPSYPPIVASQSPQNFPITDTVSGVLAILDETSVSSQVSAGPGVTDSVAFVNLTITDSASVA